MLAMHMQQYNSCFVNHFSVLSSRAPTMCQNCQNETAGDNQTSYFLLCRGSLDWLIGPASYDSAP